MLIILYLLYALNFQYFADKNIYDNSLANLLFMIVVRVNSLHEFDVLYYSLGIATVSK